MSNLDEFELAAKRAAKIDSKNKAGGKPSKSSKDAEFEKMFGININEFMDD